MTLITSLNKGCVDPLNKELRLLVGDTGEEHE